MFLYEDGFAVSDDKDSIIALYLVFAISSEFKGKTFARIPFIFISPTHLRAGNDKPCSLEPYFTVIANILRECAQGMFHIPIIHFLFVFRNQFNLVRFVSGFPVFFGADVDLPLGGKFRPGPITFRLAICGFLGDNPALCDLTGTVHSAGLSGCRFCHALGQSQRHVTFWKPGDSSSPPRTADQFDEVCKLLSSSSTTAASRAKNIFGVNFISPLLQYVLVLSFGNTFL